MLNTSPAVEALVIKLVAFVLTNRRNKAFIEWTEKQIEDTFRVAILEKELLYCTNEDDEIIGVVHGKHDDKKNTFHVTNILTIEPKCFPLFVHYLDMIYPGYTFSGMRYDKMRVYNSAKFKSKVLRN